MKKLSTENPQDWENRILKDLVFIKKHFRYPISKKILTPTVAIGFGAIFLIRYMVLIMMSGQNKPVLIIILTLFMVTFITAIIRYIKTIKFTNIATNHFLTENQEILKTFFETEHLAYFRYPEAPEVFQIISKSLFSNGEQREVMVFIADDKRILVNSHFTPPKFFLPNSNQSRKMVHMLKKWIESQNFPTGQSLMAKTN